MKARFSDARLQEMMDRTQQEQRSISCATCGKPCDRPGQFVDGDWVCSAACRHELESIIAATAPAEVSGPAL